LSFAINFIVSPLRRGLEVRGLPELPNQASDTQREFDQPVGFPRFCAHSLKDARASGVSDETTRETQVYPAV
jgi:hypothetical protein